MKFQLLTLRFRSQAISRNQFIDISPNEHGARKDRSPFSSVSHYRAYRQLQLD